VTKAIFLLNHALICSLNHSSMSNLAN